jgi:hypothetical protein
MVLISYASMQDSSRVSSTAQHVQHASSQAEDSAGQALQEMAFQDIESHKLHWVTGCWQ